LNPPTRHRQSEDPGKTGANHGKPQKQHMGSGLDHPHCPYSNGHLWAFAITHGHMFKHTPSCCKSKKCHVFKVYPPVIKGGNGQSPMKNFPLKPSLTTCWWCNNHLEQYENQWEG